MPTGTYGDTRGGRPVRPRALWHKCPQCHRSTPKPLGYVDHPDDKKGTAMCRRCAGAIMGIKEG